MTTNPTNHLRSRPDLIVARLGDETGGRYSVKDPISLEYFQFGEREAFLMDQLKTPRSIGDLQREYERRFAPEQISHDQLLAFCTTMHDCSLLVPEGPGQASVRSTRTQGRRGSGMSWLMSPLAIRLPGIDPTPLLSRLDWLGRLMFTRSAAALLFLTMAVLAVLLLGRAEELLSELSLLTDLFQPEYALAAVVAIMLLKTWHELGHGLACRRFGGECHEIGVMLLFFLPCLYCDVSDTWMLRSRWRRSVVALAGVYFEFWLASLAAVAWLVLAPGFLKVLCLYVAVVATISTLLVNLNPFLRYDGYYLLSDLWGVPNLYEQSRRALWSPLQRWIGGTDTNPPRFDASRGLLVTYAVAAIFQMTLLVAVGLWAIYRFAARNDLRFLGDVLIAAVIAGILVRFALSVRRALRSHPGNSRLGASMRLLLVGLAAGFALWLLSGVTVEQTLWSPCRIESSRTAHLTVTASGELVRSIPYGKSVERGEIVAELRDPALELRLLELQGEQAEVAARLVALRAMAQRDPELFSEIAVLETKRQELQRQQGTLKSQIEQLRIKAPFEGILVRGPTRPEDPGEELGHWTGAALDPVNRGCQLESGELVALVAAEEALQAVILLDEGDSGLATPGDDVRILLDRDPSNALRGKVVEIALTPSEDARSRPIGTADVAVEESLKRPLEQNRTFRVLVQLESTSSAAQHGAIGQARIVTGKESVRGRILRWLRQTVQGGLASL